MNAARTFRSLALALVVSAVSAVAQAGSLDVTWTAEEVRLLDLMNQERSRLNLAPLVPQAQLTLAARKHSQSMLDTGIYDHAINGQQPWDRVAAEGVTWYGSLAENITHVRTPEEAVQSWINSPGHLQNMTSPTLVRVGIGISQTEPDGARYWTVVFSRDVLEGTLGQVTMPGSSQPELAVQPGGRPDADVVPPQSNTIIRNESLRRNLSISVTNDSTMTLELVRVLPNGQETSFGMIPSATESYTLTRTGITWLLRNAETGEDVYRMSMGTESRTLRIAAQG